MKFRQWPKRDPRKNYFLVPNEVFHIGLSHPEISIYCYLLSIENRETYQCWPSYKTTAEACGISRNAAIQAIDALIQKRLIDKIPTTRRNVQSRTRTSNNEYVIHDLSELDPSA